LRNGPSFNILAERTVGARVDTETLQPQDDLLFEHARTAFLTLNGVLIVLVGPKNVVSSLNRVMQPYAYAFCFLSAAWIIGITVWMSFYELPPWTNGVTLVAMGLFFGLTFFAARIHAPVVYGVLEILAGAMGLGVLGFLHLYNSTFVLLFGTATSVYIVVRGLTNVNDALARRQSSPPAPEPSEGRDVDEREPWEFGPDPEAGSPEDAKQET